MLDLARRQSITLLGGAAVACPVGARAQQRTKPPRIGFLGLVPRVARSDGLRASLRDVGYFEGNNILTAENAPRWADLKAMRQIR
jgi:putative ABC transport system substrate-binding protein